MGVEPYTTGYPSCSNHGLSTSRRWPGLCDDGTGAVFNNVPSVQPTFENVIPDTGYSTFDEGAFRDSLNKYNQYEVAKVNQYVAATPKPQTVKIIPQTVIRTVQQQPQFGGNKFNDYTFSAFGFNRQPQEQQQQQQNNAVSVYNFATTPKPVFQQQQEVQQQQQQGEKHSAFYTYNWDSLFKNYYS